MQQPDPLLSPDDAEWWDGLYRAQTIPWDIGACAPPLQSFIQSRYAPPPGRMLVPGCGRGHDCLLFASNGFEVTGLDFAPSAIQATHDQFQQAGFLGTKGFLLLRDIFDIHEYDGYFDYVLEHTCFCAIHPSRRRTYALTVRDLLRPGGKLIGLWWILERSGSTGPPWSLSKDDLFSLFGELFDLELAFQPTDSVQQRAGQELFTVMRKY